MFNKKNTRVQGQIDNMWRWMRDIDITVRQLQSDVNFLKSQQSPINPQQSLSKRVDMLEILVDTLANKTLKPAPEYEPTLLNKYGKHTNNDSMFFAYCVKCKEKREMVNIVRKVSDSGRVMMQGNCIVCDTKMNCIMGKDY